MTQHKLAVLTCSKENHKGSEAKKNLTTYFTGYKMVITSGTIFLLCEFAIWLSFLSIYSYL